MQYIRKQQIEIKKGPFIDLNQDALTLQLQNNVGDEIACLKFKNIDLIDHACDLIQNLEFQKDCLIHKLLLGYQEVEIIHKKKEDAIPFIANVVADEEWSSAKP